MPRDGSEGDTFYRTLFQLAKIAPETFPHDLLPLRRALLADPALTAAVRADQWGLQFLVMVLYDNRVSGGKPEFISCDSPLTPYVLAALRDSRDGEPGQQAQHVRAKLREALMGVLGSSSDRLFIDAVRALLLLEGPTSDLIQAMLQRPDLGIRAALECLRDSTRVLTWLDETHMDISRLNIGQAHMMARMVLAAEKLLDELKESTYSWGVVEEWVKANLSVWAGDIATELLMKRLREEEDISKRVVGHIVNAIVFVMGGSGLYSRGTVAQHAVKGFAAALAEGNADPQGLVGVLGALGEFEVNYKCLHCVEVLLSCRQDGAREAAVRVLRQMRGRAAGSERQTEERQQERAKVLELLREWLSSGLTDVAEDAALILGECGSFNRLMLGPLVNALRSSNDTVRYRAQKILTEKRRLSELDLPCLKTLAELVRITADDGFVGLILHNCCHAIEYDQPQALSYLLVEARSAAEADHWIYQTLLSRIGHLSASATGAFCRGLSEGPPSLQAALAESAKFLFELDALEGGQLNEVLNALLSVIPTMADGYALAAAIRALSVTPEVSRPLLDVLLALLQSDEAGTPDQSRGLSSTGSAVKLAALECLGRLASRWEDPPRERIIAMFKAYARSWEPDVAAAARAAMVRFRLGYGEAGALSGAAADIPDSLDLLHALLASAADDDVWDGAKIAGQGYHSRVAQSVCGLVETEPSLLTHLFTALEAATSWPKRRICLGAIAAVAERNPAIFNTILDPATAEEALVRYSRDGESYTARRLALTALSYLRRVSSRVVPVLLEACRDEENIQRDAMLAVRRFRQVDPAVLPELFAALRHPSARVSYAVAQLLSELGSSRQALEDEGLRASIAEALADALRDAEHDREVYGATPDRGWALMGRTSEALYGALARVVGAV